MAHLIPLVGQLRRYTPGDFRGDLSAGLTVGVMLIPQGMAYALIAGMPPVYGLYAALIPLAIYAVLGSSRDLAVGPVAMVALLTAAAVGPLAGGDPVRYVALAALLAGLVGVVQLAGGALRLGFLVNFISHPVISGFTSAAAIIIAASQAKHVLGAPLPAVNRLHEALQALYVHAGAIHLPTLLLGSAALAVLILMRRYAPLLPAGLAVVAAGTAFAYLADAGRLGIGVVGEIPSGLPTLAVPAFGMDDAAALLPAAVAIALIAFLESIAVARAIAARKKYAVDPNQELVALGTANIGAAFFQAFPVTGGFSRSAVNADAGARTQLAGIIAAIIVAVTLVLLTPLFSFLPYAVLGAIIIAAVATLIDVAFARYLWRVRRRDFAMFALTFLGTLFIGIKEGLAIGVVVSLAVYVYQSSRTKLSVLGHVPGTGLYRDVAVRSDARTAEEVLVVRLDGPLLFANAAEAKRQFLALLHEREDVRAVVLDAYPVNDIDASGLHVLTELVLDLRRDGVAFFVASARKPLRDILERGGIPPLLSHPDTGMDVSSAVRLACSTDDLPVPTE